jgi:hypothetical protein
MYLFWRCTIFPSFFLTVFSLSSDFFLFSEAATRSMEFKAISFIIEFPSSFFYYLSRQRRVTLLAC